MIGHQNWPEIHWDLPVVELHEASHDLGHDLVLISCLVCSS